MTNKTKFLISLLVFVLCIAGGVPNADGDVSMRKGPYLIYPGECNEPNSYAQMTVLWQLDAEEACKLEWGTSISYGTDVNTTEYGDDHQHKYTITGLTPALKYFYRVEVGEDSGDFYTGSFWTTLAADATNVKFLVYGDTRSYPEDHNTVCAAMLGTFTDSNSDPNYQTFLLHSGDWVSDGENEDDWTDEYFNRSYSGTMELQANLPINGCIGNHEVWSEAFPDTLFAKYWPYPDSNWYEFYYGPVHIVVIHDYRWEDGAKTFPAGDLADVETTLANSDREWKFIVLHAPGWSAHRIPSGNHPNNGRVQDEIQPICEDNGVDIVFAGHNHYYAHCDVNEVQHITTGGGGANLSTPDLDYDPNHIVKAAREYHFCEIDIQGNVLNFTARDVNGAEIESFTLGANGTSKLYIRDGSSENVASFDDFGKVLLKGTLTQNTTPTATSEDEFRIKDANGTDVAIIDSNDGNMYISGMLSKWQETLEEASNFIIRNSSGSNVAYIDQSGDMYLKGGLYEEAEP